MSEEIEINNTDIEIGTPLGDNDSRDITIVEEDNVNEKGNNEVFEIDEEEKNDDAEMNLLSEDDILEEDNDQDMEEKLDNEDVEKEAPKQQEDEELLKIKSPEKSTAGNIDQSADTEDHHNNTTIYYEALDTSHIPESPFEYVSPENTTDANEKEAGDENNNDLDEEEIGDETFNTEVTEQPINEAEEQQQPAEDEVSKEVGDYQNEAEDNVKDVHNSNAAEEVSETDNPKPIEKPAEESVEEQNNEEPETTVEANEPEPENDNIQEIVNAQEPTPDEEETTTFEAAEENDPESVEEPEAEPEATDEPAVDHEEQKNVEGAQDVEEVDIPENNEAEESYNADEETVIEEQEEQEEQDDGEESEDNDADINADSPEYCPIPVILLTNVFPYLLCPITSEKFAKLPSEYENIITLFDDASILDFTFTAIFNEVKEVFNEHGNPFDEDEELVLTFKDFGNTTIEESSVYADTLLLKDIIDMFNTVIENSESEDDKSECLCIHLSSRKSFRSQMSKIWSMRKKSEEEDNEDEENISETVMLPTDEPTDQTAELVLSEDEPENGPTDINDSEEGEEEAEEDSSIFSTKRTIDEIDAEQEGAPDNDDEAALKKAKLAEPDNEV